MEETSTIYNNEEHHHQRLLEGYPFRRVTTQGEVIYKDGWHNPLQGRRRFSCGCNLTTPNGAYRDTIVRLDDCEVYYLHQNPIVVKKGEVIQFDTCEYKSKTTKRRMNRWSMHTVFQKDFNWYLREYNSEEVVSFRDGIHLPQVSSMWED